jgi:hypothetical protein
LSGAIQGLLSPAVEKPAGKKDKEYGTGADRFLVKCVAVEMLTFVINGPVVFSAWNVR